ncbi:MAG: hypothetical protein NTW80_03855 [Deltaproteobacteria bacterium]|nr:hypothetical protein [Deltaproteobacteria bacterium]
MWGAVICFFAFWKIAKRYLLKKPIEIPEEIGLEKKEEFLTQQRKIYSKASRGLNRILFFSGFALAADSVILSLLASFGLASGQRFVLPGIILATSLIPGFFLLMILSAFTNDYLKRLNENDCILKSAAKKEAGKIWLMNLLPLLALVLFYQARLDLLNQLGFGTGLALAVIVLSLVFFTRKEMVGLGVNVILLGFVFVSYLAPQFEDVCKYALNHGAGWFIGAYAIQVLPLLAMAMGVAQLAKHPLVDRIGVSSPEMSKVASHYLMIPFLVAAFTPIIGITLQVKKIFPYSLTVVSLQALAWGAVLLSLSLTGRRVKVDFAAIQDYLRKDRNYRLPFDRTFLRLVVLALLLLSTAFETYRGQWLFFGLTIIWAGLMCLSLWKVWKYAFPE